MGIERIRLDWTGWDWEHQERWGLPGVFVHKCAAAFLVDFGGPGLLAGFGGLVLGSLGIVCVQSVCLLGVHEENG